MIESLLVQTASLILPGSLNRRAEGTEKSMFVTFDDGPIPHVTPWVLDTLAHYKARATFFCIGDNVRKHPDIFRQITERGHAVGNHTFNHLKAWHTPLQDYLANAEKADDLIKSELFRPPHGQITPHLARILSKKYRVVMWDVLTRDYDRKLSPEKCLQGAVRKARSGSVIVFHDSLKAWERLEYALPRFLDHFGRQGFEFRALSADLLK